LKRPKPYNSLQEKRFPCSTKGGESNSSTVRTKRLKVVFKNKKAIGEDPPSAVRGWGTRQSDREGKL